MASGRVSVAVFGCLLTAFAWADARRGDVDALLESLEREPPQTIAFLEVRSSPLLERELVLEGRLELHGPGRLTRVVLGAYAERTVIDGDEVRIQREGRAERRFSLDRAPGLGAFLTGLAAILSGDRATLEREFELALTGATDDWQLALVPRSRELQGRVGAIRLRGANDATRCIVTVGAGGETVAELLLGEAARHAGDAGQRALKCGALP